MIPWGLLAKPNEIVMLWSGWNQGRGLQQHCYSSRHTLATVASTTVQETFTLTLQEQAHAPGSHHLSSEEAPPQWTERLGTVAIREQ